MENPITKSSSLACKAAYQSKSCWQVLQQFTTRCDRKRVWEYMHITLEHDKYMIHYIRWYVHCGWRYIVHIQPLSKCWKHVYRDWKYSQEEVWYDYISLSIEIKLTLSLLPVMLQIISSWLDELNIIKEETFAFYDVNMLSLCWHTFRYVYSPKVNKSKY